MDQYLLSRVPPIVQDLQKTDTNSVQTRIEEAIQRMRLTTSDDYNSISVFSVYWESDETGGKDDSSLFIDTLSKLRNVQTYQRSLSDKDYSLRLGLTGQNYNQVIASCSFSIMQVMASLAVLSIL